MSEAKHEQFGFGDSPDAEVTQYRAVCGLAVVGLIAGIAALLAMVHPMLWIVPAGGIVLSVAALRRIGRDALVGRKAALAGLILSVLFGAIGPADWFTYRRLVDREAERFGLQWFDLLRQGEMLKSYQLREPPASRPPLDDRLWEEYEPGSPQRSALQEYVDRAEIRSLLALGTGARVRYYDTEGQSRADGADEVSQVYAVIADEPGRKTSYFVRLDMRRYTDAGTGRAYWQLLDFQGGIRPRALGGEEAGREG